MPQRVRVKLNIPALVSHLTREERRKVSIQELERWLADAGFTRLDKDYWVVSEADLGQVEPSEVLEAEPFNGNEP